MPAESTLTDVAKLGAIEEMLFKPTWIALIRGAVYGSKNPVESIGRIDAVSGSGEDEDMNNVRQIGRLAGLTERDVSKTD